MSEQQVEQLLRTYEHINNGDLDVVTASLAPGFELIPPPMLPEGNAYHGPDGLRQLWETWSSAFEGFRVEVEETIDAGDKVIVMAAVSGTHKDSGLEMRTPSFAWVWSFEGGTAVRMEAMPNRATAVEALGLSELSE
jgi:ketosteroid isomerase-like protein